MQAHRIETKVGEHGELRLEGLPFDPGQPVEVLVISKDIGFSSPGTGTLRHSVLDYREPFEPVADEHVDAMG